MAWTVLSDRKTIRYTSTRIPLIPGKPPYLSNFRKSIKISRFAKKQKLKVENWTLILHSVTQLTSGLVIILLTSIGGMLYYNKTQ